jgi:hypothetical protein
VVSAVPSSSDPRGFSETIRSTTRNEHARRCVSAKTKRELRRRCQRFDPIERRGSNRPTLVTGSREDEGTREAFGGDGAEAVSGVVKTPGPPVMQRDDHGSSRGVPGRESGSSELGTYGARVIVNRSGGRSR